MAVRLLEAPECKIIELKISDAEGIAEPLPRITRKLCGPTSENLGGPINRHPVGRADQHSLPFKQLLDLASFFPSIWPFVPVPRRVLPRIQAYPAGGRGSRTRPRSPRMRNFLSQRCPFPAVHSNGRKTARIAAVYRPGLPHTGGSPLFGLYHVRFDRPAAPFTCVIEVRVRVKRRVSVGLV